jgi:hypothetical protein
MLSDTLIPLLDPHQPNQVGAYQTALHQLEEAASHIDVMVPGHSTIAQGPEKPAGRTVGRRPAGAGSISTLTPL